MPRIKLKRKEPENDQCVLQLPIAQDLKWFLPPVQKEADVWECLYSNFEDGYSFHTLVRNCGEGPLMLAIKTLKGDIFGAFLSDGLQIQTGYYGNGSCFLWKYNKSGNVAVYLATEKNEYYLHTEEHCLALGGGSARFGLWIDSNLLNGHSDSCETFNNLPLTDDKNFEIDSLEVWGFRM